VQDSAGLGLRERAANLDGAMTATPPPRMTPTPPRQTFREWWAAEGR